MREIKFRVWNGEKIYQVINRLDFTLDGNLIGTTKFKFMQYTGLKDKNGVEIYEGDICRCYGGVQEFGQYEYSGIYEVKYTGNGFDMIKNNCGLY